MHYRQQKHIKGVTLEDIYVGNGVSELIVMAMNALLDNGDEVLVPAPDYPLWTAAISLSGAHRSTICATRTTPAGCRTWTTSAARSPRTTGHCHHQPEQPDRCAVSGRCAEKSSTSPVSTSPSIPMRSTTRCFRRRNAYRDRLAVGGRAHHHLQRAVEKLSLLRPSVPAGWWSPVTSACRDYIEGPRHAGLDASVRQCARQHGIQTALGGYQSIDDWWPMAAACVASAMSPTN